jgi:hypothetical protein
VAQWGVGAAGPDQHDGRDDGNAAGEEALSVLRGQGRRSSAGLRTWSTSVHNLDNVLNGLTVAPLVQ